MCIQWCWIHIMLQPSMCCLGSRLIGSFCLLICCHKLLRYDVGVIHSICQVTRRTRLDCANLTGAHHSIPTVASRCAFPAAFVLNQTAECNSNEQECTEGAKSTHERN